MSIECFVAEISFDLELICIVNIELQLFLLLADICDYSAIGRVIHKSNDLFLYNSSN